MTEALEQPEELEALLEFLRDARGFDFTGYKRTSLQRRIRKRMQDMSIANYLDYRDFLETNADEFQTLFNTILINVTGFYRDTTAWQYLQRDIIPDIIAATDPAEEIRVWSAGCSSGEEAYSLAIVFAELLGASDFVNRVKIYGTDVDEDALREARAGTYAPKALESLPEGALQKYFEPAGSNFVFRPELRRRVIFGRHDITRDAPISRLHLLACRNTLMYFNVEAQAEIIDRFHFALRERGYLFLGKAEMLLSDGDRFEVANMRQRVFRRRPGENVLLQPPPLIRFETSRATASMGDTNRRQLRDLTLEITPNGVITLDQETKIVLINNQMRAAFGLSSNDIGRPFQDIELSYRPTELRSLVERARSERRTLRLAGVEMRRGLEDVDYYDIIVQPLLSPEGAHLGTAIIFDDTTHATRLQLELKRSREDLETAYEELQSTNEELETTNEELQSSIEELETTNEELQSTNEELETTNEELQSGNEELETMNEEMRSRSGELDEARTFLELVLGSVAAAVVVLDKALVVRSWNRGAQDMWGIRSEEVIDQHFFSLDFGLPTAELREPVNACLADGRPTASNTQLEAVNRLGRRIVCSVACSPLAGQRREGVVLLIEQVRQDP